MTSRSAPTSCSWLNLVECFFSIITRQAIRRGTFPSVAELTAAIDTYIDHWNNHAEPFTWTKPPTNSSTRSTVQRLKQATLQSTSTVAVDRDRDLRL